MTSTIQTAEPTGELRSVSSSHSWMNWAYSSSSKTRARRPSSSKETPNSPALRSLRIFGIGVFAGIFGFAGLPYTVDSICRVSAFHTYCPPPGHIKVRCQNSRCTSIGSFAGYRFFHSLRIGRFSPHCHSWHLSRSQQFLDEALELLPFSAGSRAICVERDAESG